MPLFSLEQILKRLSHALNEYFPFYILHLKKLRNMNFVGNTHLNSWILSYDDVSFFDFHHKLLFALISAHFYV